MKNILIYKTAKSVYNNKILWRKEKKVEKNNYNKNLKKRIARMSKFDKKIEIF